jgi:hypothetical protein
MYIEIQNQRILEKHQRVEVDLAAVDAADEQDKEQLVAHLTGVRGPAAGT